MRIISFSDIRFVRAILDGSKVQTIRPLFPYHARWKKPIHKAGDKVKLVYKQRVLKKDDWFCPECGMVIDIETGETKDDGTLHTHGRTECLPKHFATAEVTEVRKN